MVWPRLFLEHLDAHQVLYRPAKVGMPAFGLQMQLLAERSQVLIA